MRAREKKGPEGKLSRFRNGRDENNLAEFPVALLSDSAPHGQKTVEYEDTLEDWSTGALITRRVCITGSDKFGLPTAKDEEVLLALIQLTKLANNFASAEVDFTKHQVIEILGWRNEGWAYDRVEESLHRWKGVSIHYWNAWRDHSRGKWKDSAAVGVIDYFVFADGRQKSYAAGENRVGLSRFVWHKVFFESFESRYLKKLDFDTYRNLERPGAKRAYRFLDKRFFHKPIWEFDLREFACEKLGFSRSYTTGQLKERLNPVLNELEGIGFIEPVGYRKERPKVWKVAISKKVVNEEVEAAGDTDAVDVVRELGRRGVEEATARRLSAEFSIEYIAAKITCYDWLKSRSDRRVSKNGPGFLVSSISRDFPPPKEFVRQHENGKRHQCSATQAVKFKRDKRTNETEGASAEELSISSHLRALSRSALAEIAEKAVAEATPVEQDAYRRLEGQGGTLFLEMRESILRKHVLKHGLHLENRIPARASSVTGRAER